MNAMVGIVRGYTYEKNRDGEETVNMLTVEVTDQDDLQTIELVSQIGEDYNPPIGSRVIIVDVSPSYRLVIASDDFVTPESLPGEREIYSTSTDGTSKQAFVKMLTDGQCRINGTGDFAVRFNELQTEFNKLRDAFNDFIDVYDDHTHGGVTTGTGATGPAATPGVKTSADLTSARVDTVELPANEA
jgi:methyl-accepting chemotaxis protein